MPAAPQHLAKSARVFTGEPREAAVAGAERSRHGRLREAVDEQDYVEKAPF
jgi:hypothetical protein